MTRDYGKKSAYRTSLQDLMFLTSVEIVYDNCAQYFKVLMPNGTEFIVTIDRLLDIF